MERIQADLKVGKISKHRDNGVKYQVRSNKYLDVIIAHGQKYPLITQKRADFELFKQVLDLIKRKEHLTLIGLQKIVNLRASMNKGLSDELRAAFSNTIPATRPLVVDQEIKDPH